MNVLKTICLPTILRGPRNQSLTLASKSRCIIIFSDRTLPSNFVFPISGVRFMMEYCGILIPYKSAEPLQKTWRQFVLHYWCSMESTNKRIGVGGGGVVVSKTGEKGWRAHQIFCYIYQRCVINKIHCYMYN